MVDVEVEFSYDATQEDELTIKVGDIIRNVVKQDGGWWEGELDGKKGLFPDNFVKEIKDEVHRKDTLHKKEDMVSHRKEDSSLHRKEEGSLQKKDGSHVKELKNVLSKQPVQASTVPGVVRRNKDSTRHRMQARVAFSYTPENVDEIPLEVGDLVDVLDQEEEGWWKGSVRGNVGMFPSNFVEVIPSTEAEENEKNDRTEKKEINEEKAGDAVEIKGKKVKGIGLGNIFENQEIKLRPTGSTKGPPSVPHLDDAPSGPPRPIKPRGSIKTQKVGSIKKFSRVEKAKVLFSYDAQDKDELTLNEGDVVTVLDKEIEDSGWWLGEINGKKGVFPDNFVELIPPEEPKPKKPPPPVIPPPNTAGPKKIEKSSSDLKSSIKKGDVNEKSAPPLPNKKPDLPPPLRKPSSQKSDGKQGDKRLSVEDTKNELDVIESTEPLKSLTSSRPRNIKKRPPSMELLRKENGTEENEVPLMTDSASPPQTTSSLHRGAEKKEEKETKKAPALPPPPRAEPRLQPAHKERPKSLLGEPGTSSKELEELRKEIRHLKDTTVSRTAYDDLNTEVKSLKEQIESMRQSFSKRLYELMDELDKEIKIRLSTEVDVERIKKLHMSK